MGLSFGLWTVWAPKTRLLGAALCRAVYCAGPGSGQIFAGPQGRSQGVGPFWEFAEMHGVLLPPGKNPEAP